MGVLDWIICVAAVVLMVVQGWWVSGGQKTTDDYFVGGRQMGWLAVGLSMFAATFSPLSFVGLPREAAYDNYHLYLAILFIDRKSTRLNSSHRCISYAVFCWKKT